MTLLAVEPKNLPDITNGEESRLPEISWFAGLFDGEGYVGLAENTHNGRLRSFAPQIQLGNTHGRAVKLFQYKFGGSCEINQANTRGRKRKFYFWRQYSVGMIIPALEEMLPHLIIKAEQARLVLKYCRLPWRGSGGQRTLQEADTDIGLAERVSALKVETPQYSWE